MDSADQKDTTTNQDALDRVAGLNAEELKQLLLRCWMTHDATWFKAALDEFGISAANTLNLAAIRGMAPSEVRRVLASLSMTGVADLEQLRRFMGACATLLVGDYMAWSYTWTDTGSLVLEVHDCFACKGITRLGAIEDYSCGIFARIYAWFDALALNYEVSPDRKHCQMRSEGHCRREFRFTFGVPVAG